MLPKSSAEILAAAKRAHSKQDPRKTVHTNNPVAPRPLDPAFAVDSDEFSEDLFDDDSILASTWVSTSCSIIYISNIIFNLRL